LEQAQKHGQAISEAFPNSKAALEKIGANMRKAAERISQKERSINKEFESLGGEFRAQQAASDAVQEQLTALQREVGELQRDLTEKTDAIELAKSSVSERNNSMTDVSPLRRLTTSLSTLKKELQHMELRIGVVAHTLLQAKLKSQHNHHKEKGR
jgi:estrogen-related receptor beta like 1